MPPGRRDMILCAAKKLIGIARMIEKIVAIKPVAMVSIMEPATNVLTLLLGAANPKLTCHLGAGRSLTLPTISSRLSLQRIVPAVVRSASLLLMYLSMQLQAQILSSPLM